MSEKETKEETEKTIMVQFSGEKKVIALMMPTIEER